MFYTRRFRLMAAFLFSMFCMFVVLSAASDKIELAGTKYEEDINGDGVLNITDAISLLLLGRDDPSDPEADYDGNGVYAVNDVIALLLNIFSGNLTPEQSYNPGAVLNFRGIDMAYIPAGSFMMGSEDGEEDEKPVHEVFVDEFWMGVTEVTQFQYEALIHDNPSYTVNERNPVETITWYDAVTYCNKLSEEAGYEPCFDPENWSCDFSKNGFRLPTEAEWEYACRAGTTTKYYTGNSESDLDVAGWYAGNSIDGLQKPVADKIPNHWNLYDMHGNVKEWCVDFYDKEYYSVSPGENPTGPETGDNLNSRVTRSGCACYVAEAQRSASRGHEPPTFGNFQIGMRVVRTP
jgi:formylglycine-generating enzyme required for sulfatase activity